MDLVSWTFASTCPDPDKPLLIDPSEPSRSLSYNGVRSYVRRLVAGLQAVGVQQGDCVCVNSFNDLFYSTLYLGSIGSGAIFTGVNPAYTTTELVHHLQLTNPKIIIAEPSLIVNTLEAASKVGIPLSNVYLFDVHGKASHGELQSWQKLLEHGEADWVRVSNPHLTVAHYAATSGTSGLPKAAMLSHSYHVTQAAAQLWNKDSLPYARRRLTALPPFHVFATPIIPSAIRLGIPTYVMRRFEMEPFLEYIERFEITETYLPPPVLVGMPLSPLCSGEGLRSLRQIWFGGASLSYGNQVSLYALLHSEARIQPVWGMTEAGWITAGVWPEKHTDDSAGRALPDFEIKIVDDSGRRLSDEGAIGDIVIKSPAMMLGYVANEKATREAFDTEGWLRTGDIGQLTEGNKVFVVDRKKDLMKVRTWQVSPVEVEGILLQHPDIVDAAVIGIPLANNTGDIPRAYIVLRPNANLSVPKIKSFLAKSLANYKIPEEFVCTDRIPKNPTGKILRRILRDQATGIGKPEPSELSLQKGTSRGPWRYVRVVSDQASLLTRVRDENEEDEQKEDQQGERSTNPSKD